MRHTEQGVAGCAKKINLKSSTHAELREFPSSACFPPSLSRTHNITKSDVPTRHDIYLQHLELCSIRIILSDRAWTSHIRLFNAREPEPSEDRSWVRRPRCHPSSSTTSSIFSSRAAGVHSLEPLSVGVAGSVDFFSVLV